VAKFGGSTFNGESKPVIQERRASPRFTPSGAPEAIRAHLPSDQEARLINVSRGGVLLETTSQLAPGAVIFVRLVAADAVFLLRGQVCRTRPTLLRGTDLLYESAVAFDGNYPRPVVAANAGQDPASDGSGASGPLADTTAAAKVQGPAPYTVTASIPRSGPDLHQIFGLNHW
jgi:hypothetical protein